MKKFCGFLPILILTLTLSGCWVESYDDIGAQGKVKIGGILAYIVDLEISGKVGFTRNKGVTNDETKEGDAGSYAASWL